MGTMTTRQAFNFYRSYYEILDDIHRPEDKLAYLLALLDKQFNGIEPELSGIPKLAYNSQKHSIEKQCKGWEDKTKTKLSLDVTNPTEGPTQDPWQGGEQGPTEGGYEDPWQQEQEKEQEEEEVKEEVKVKEQVKVKGTNRDIFSDIFKPYQNPEPMFLDIQLTPEDKKLAESEIDRVLSKKIQIPE